MEASNMKAMREALVRTDSFLSALGKWLKVNDEGQEYALATGVIHTLVERALSAPPRNCDLFGGDYKMLHTAWFDWTGSPSGQNPDGTAKMGFGEWLLAPIDARFVKCENLPRQATEAEVDSGEAKWCAACAADCPEVGKDILVKCGRFRESDKCF